MQLIYAQEQFPQSVTKSIMICGPTPRTVDVESWRPKAIEYLEKLGYDGVVYIPEPRSGVWNKDYDAQIAWEDSALSAADCILFWVPRDMATMPALTTNDEWGTWKSSGKCVFGSPPEAVSVRYQRHYADVYRVPTADTLEETCRLAVDKVGVGALRCDAECQIPLHIWESDSFQSWYWALVRAGNRLDSARVLWSFFTPKQNKLFCWVLRVSVYVSSECRYKDAEFVLARPDISSVVMYRRPNDQNQHHMYDTEVVLVKEFRSPVSNEAGFVFECPSGSSWKPNQDTLTMAGEEVFEETGLQIEPHRFKFRDCRQMVATLSSHQANVYSVELTQDELDRLKAERGNVVHGAVGDSEQTYVYVFTVGEIIKYIPVDWSTLGIIMSVVA